MRRGEIAAMRWKHLDKKARVLLIPETKTGTPRRVPLSSRALVVLDALPPAHRWCCVEHAGGFDFAGF